MIFDIIRRIWHFAGSINVTMAVMGAMVADLVWGYAMLRYYGSVFSPINDLGFVRWALTWGAESPDKTAWLFILTGLLGLLAVNTFTCTTDRVIQLVRSRRGFQSFSALVMRFAPHVMHYSMLLMFLGYLVSYMCAWTLLGQVVLPGRTIEAGNTRISLEKLEIDYYHGTRIAGMNKRAIKARAFLRLESEGKVKTCTLGFNRPVYFEGMSIHLKKISPETASGSMTRQKFISLIIKKDPGLWFYFTGMFFFTAGLFMYVLAKIRKIL
jgi:hypothetical protein